MPTNTSKSPARKASSKSPVRKASSKSPVRKASSKSPVRKATNTNKVAASRSPSRSETPTRKSTNSAASARGRTETPARKSVTTAAAAAAEARRDDTPTSRKSQSSVRLDDEPRIVHFKSNDPTLKQANTSEDVFKRTPERDTWDGRYEFGGPIGAAAIMAFSHVVPYYLWICIDFFNGALIHPWSAELKDENMAVVFWRIVCENAVPELWVFASFVGLLFFEYLFAVAVPAPIAWGLPVPSENNYVHKYKVNGVYCWYFILASLGAAHYYDVFPLWTIRDYYGQFLTSAVIVADVAAVLLYVVGVTTGRSVRMTGNVVYDFFMGAVLNPKFPGNVDMKLFAEIRNSWVLTFTLACSSAAKMYQEQGYISDNMLFLLLAYFLYCNACQKGEECIPTTWDIHHEKFGWMLVYWNTCGVAFVYSTQAMYLQQVAPTFSYSYWVLAPLTLFLLFCYKTWDEVNGQKNRFRMERVGVPQEILRRKTLPYFSSGYVKDPRVLVGKAGTLFIDGWYRHARKLHYTVDTCMAIMWAASCGFSSAIPWFYPVFFIGMILDREQRDVARSARKYGPMWDAYLKIVPYKYIPGVY